MVDLMGLLLLLALTAYAVLGGADFGGGIWDLLARGPRAADQRAAIARAMGPVWEANHVWLIFAIVILFAGFPSAFAAVSTALFVPLHLVLVGIVLRGAAFVFRGPLTGLPGRVWAAAFGAASTVTPFLLGACLAAVSAGGIRVVEGRVLAHPWLPWLGAFPLLTGALALALCAYLAAVYLTVETEGALQEDFRRRALGAGAAVALIAWVLLPVLAHTAPWLWHELFSPRAAPLLAAGGLLAAASLWAVSARRYRLARAAAAAQVAVLLWGWALAQWPYLIYPDVPAPAVAAPPQVLRLMAWATAGGMVLLLPSLWFLFRVFKGNSHAPSPETSPGIR